MVQRSRRPVAAAGRSRPAVRGFTIPNAELTLDGAVDPYFKGFANIVYKIDAEGETASSSRRCIFLTTSLPAESAAQGRAVLHRVRPTEPAASALVGVRGPAAGAQPDVRARRTAQPGRAALLAGADVVVHRGDGDACSQQRRRDDVELSLRGIIRRFTAACRSSARCATASDLLIVPRLTTSFDLTATQTLLSERRRRSGRTTRALIRDTRSTAPTSTGSGSRHGRAKDFRSCRSRPRDDPPLRARRSVECRGRPAGHACRPRRSRTMAGTRRCCGASSRAWWPGCAAEFVSGDAAAFDSELRADRSGCRRT